MKLSTSTYLKNIEGISPKVLSQKLKMLERRFYRTKNSGYFPIRVDYSLTPLGQNVAAMAYQLKVG